MGKRILSCFICILAAFCSMTEVSYCQNNSEDKPKNNVMKEYFVSPSGADNNDGSNAAPFKTIERAREAVREVNTLPMTGDIVVNIENGTYILDDTITLDPEDSGNNGYNVVYKGNGNPLISGGRKIENFTMQENGMWKAYVPDMESMRELYVNDTRVYRASTEREVRGVGDYNDPNTGYEYDGIYFDRNVLDIYENADKIEFRWGVGWKCQDMIVDKIIPDPDDNTRVIAIMKQPYYNFAATVPKWGHAARWDYGFRIENAFELLDSPGEYYFNNKTHELFYIPREGEDISTAQVYAPVLDKLLIINGDGKTKVKNIRFENIRFAHAAYSVADITGYSHGQAGENFIGRSRYERTTGAAIEVSNADCINFEKCIIFGTGACGIMMRHAVENSSFVGGAIYDVGETGIAVGCPPSAGISRDTEPPAGYMGDALYNSLMKCSDYGGFGYGLFALFADQDGYWEPVNDIPTGTESWVSADFGKEISVDEIILKIEGKADTQKSNFKILLSNDADFASYKVIYEQWGKPFEGDTLRFSPKVGEKFRYIKVQKSKVEAFRISELQVLSKDIPWQPRTMNKNITVGNNYITRTGNNFYGSPAICSYYTEDLLIEHNEIYKTPYTAISAGWGWSNGSTWTKRTKIYNNRIDSYNMESQDGGGLYTLSRCEDSHIMGNYFSNEHGPFGAIYFDEGSADFLAEDNVVENSNCPVFIWINTDMDINVKNTYSNSPVVRNSGTNTYVDPIKTYVAGNPTPEAKRIIDNAGIETVYADIKTLVPDNEPYYGRYIYDDYSSATDHYASDYMTQWGEGFVKLAEETLATASCGNNPGQYGAKEKAKLEARIKELEMKTRSSDSVGYGQAERIMRIREALNTLENSLIRMPYNEALACAEELLAKTNIGKGLGECSAEAKTEFEQALTRIKALQCDEYERVYELEKAIDKFDRSILKADITAFEVIGEDIESDIDEKNRVVTLYVNDSTDIKNMKANPLCSYGAKVYPDFSAGIDISQPVSAVVRNGNVNTAWTIRTEPVNEKCSSPSGWWNWYEARPYKRDGGLLFKPQERPYMFIGERKSSISFDLEAKEIDNNGVSVVFLSDKAQLISESLDGKHSYFELNLSEKNVKLYRIENNVKKIIYGGAYDKNKVFNKIISAGYASNLASIQITSHAEGSRNRVEVSVNGKKVINTLCEVDKAITSGYWGIKTVKTDVVLKNIK